MNVQSESESNRQVQMTMINFKRTGGSMDREMTMDFDLLVRNSSPRVRVRGCM